MKTNPSRSRVPIKIEKSPFEFRLRACLKTRPVRAPGLQQVDMAANFCRPRALTRRADRVFKHALSRDSSVEPIRMDHRDAMCPARRSRSGPETSQAPGEIKGVPCGQLAAAGAPRTQPRSGKTPRDARGVCRVVVPSGEAATNTNCRTQQHNSKVRNGGRISVSCHAAARFWPSRRDD